MFAMKKSLIRISLMTSLLLLVAIYLVKRPTIVWSDAQSANPQAVASELRQHVRYLSEQLPSRSYAELNSLNQAAHYIERVWQSHGLEVSRQSYQVDGVFYHNLIARLGPADGELLVIGAHYDAFDDLPGADDNASGVAGLLELGRLLAENPPPVAVELVAYSLEEPPHFATENMGSARHAAAVQQPVRLMIALEMIGYFSDQPGSQRYPLAALGWLYPDTGDFIAVVDQLFSTQAQQLKAVLNQYTTLPAYSINAPAGLVGVDFSDHRNYWARGIPAVMITDTAFYRNQNYHTPEDTWHKLDYARMAQVIDGVVAFVHLGLD
jgi:Zn-dependent M28 family amino/carboxypeptidase